MGVEGSTTQMTHLSYHKEKATKLVLKGWQKDYKTKAKYSTFCHSTNQLPTTKPSRSFQKLKDDPEVFDHLTQLQTMHSFNTYYYY